VGQDIALTSSASVSVPRGVFDTNVVVSALVFGRRLEWLRVLWARGAVVPVVCRETVAELLKVLSYPKFRLDRAEREALLADYLPYAEVLRLPASRPAVPVVCRDRNDMIFIELALAAAADFLASGDSDLVTLQGSLTIPVVAVSDLRDFLRRP
jgi:putative PIN family toxin of toxin-antitoxin system